MDMMSLRRQMMGVIASMAGGGKTIPSCMDIVEYTVSETSRYHTISHNLGKVPSMFMIIPKVEETGTGTNNSYCYSGFSMGTSGINDYPNKLIQNYKTASGNWDYSGSNIGWKADSSSIQIDLGTTAYGRLKAQDYWVYIFTYA